MDCRTARLLLEYARPRCAELDPTERQALEEHLASCEACDQLAAAERRADAAVGKAMRQVDTPDRLRNRILDRLSEERGDRRRRWISYGLCGAAAAAALLMAMLGTWRWLNPRPAFPVQEQIQLAWEWGISPPDAAHLEAMIKSHGVQATAPTDLNYNYLRWMFLTDVKGRQTPLLIFHNEQSGQDALVFLVSDRQFDVKALPSKLEPAQPGGGYEYKCDIHHGQGEPFGYVVYFTGNDDKWLAYSPAQQQAQVAGDGN